LYIEKAQNPIRKDIADAELCTIRDLIGHSNVKITQRYCRVSNLMVQRDCFKVMEVIMGQRVVSLDST
jgi:hypothetical protein